MNSFNKFNKKNILLFILASVVAFATCGCGDPPPFPKMSLKHCCGKADPASDIVLPAEPAVTNAIVSSSIKAPLRIRHFSRTQWRPFGRSQFDTSRSVGFIMVHAPLEKGLSPYTGGSLPVVTRLITASGKGRLFYTPRLFQTDSSPMKGLKYISPSIFIMQSPHGTVGQNGVLTAPVMDPLKVAQSGYVVNVSMRSTSYTEQLAIPPRFTGLSYLDYTHPSARRGADGRRGSDGARGRSGTSGRNGAAATSYSGRGGNATSGSNGSRGSDGTRGADGQPGQVCSNAPSMDIKAIPLYSKFYEKPLAHYQFRHGSRIRNVVLTWGQGIKVSARGGAGGNGGDGGNGGNGGYGGPGGKGGNGGAGGRGRDGSAGMRGSPGRNATRTTRGTSGGRGGNGGPGGPGGDGGNGARGGNGGSGANGGDGGIGGDGGNGGNGARVTVNIAGSGSFDQMVRAALNINVSGGRGGDGGEPGSGGIRGNGGPGGDRGYAGPGGSGGNGGPGGPGGAGGRSYSWTERVPIPGRPGYYSTVRRSMPGGSNGYSGSRGPRGRSGNSGMSGESGTAGPSGRNGAPGRAGRNGSNGSSGNVIFNAKATATTIVSGDVRMVRVSDGRVIAAASCRAPLDELASQTNKMAAELKAKVAEQDTTVAVTVFRDRTKSALGSAAAEELSVKLSGALVKTDWFIVRERLYLKEVLEERDLDLVGLVNNPEARKQLGGVKYVVVGSVSTESK